MSSPYPGLTTYAIYHSTVEHPNKFVVKKVTTACPSYTTTETLVALADTLADARTFVPPGHEKDVPPPSAPAGVALEMWSPASVRAAAPAFAQLVCKHPALLLATKQFFEAASTATRPDRARHDELTRAYANAVAEALQQESSSSDQK